MWPTPSQASKAFTMHRPQSVAQLSEHNTGFCRSLPTIAQSDKIPELHQCCLVIVAQLYLNVPDLCGAACVHPWLRQLANKYGQASCDACTSACLALLLPATKVLCSATSELLAVIIPFFLFVGTHQPLTHSVIGEETEPQCPRYHARSPCP